MIRFPIILSLACIGIFAFESSAFGITSRTVTRLLRCRPTSSIEAKQKVLSPDEAEAATQPLMQLASAHFASQALHAIVQLGIPDFLGDSKMTVSQIASHLQENCGNTPNEDALLRTMRLLANVEILNEDFDNKEYYFSLSNTGALLQTNVPGQSSVAPCVQHWMERPLWNSWLDLADYIAGDKGTKLPFDRANRMSSDEFYGKHNPDSLQYANQFVRFISNGEVEAVLNGFDWNTLSGQTVVDIGGHYGGIMAAVAQKNPEIRCICLDLPEVVSSAPPPPPGIELVGGDVFDPSTIPTCDVIFMKHILDKCMWDEAESVRLLQSCHSALPPDGKVIIAEAVTPDDAGSADGFQMQLYIDVLFLLVGRQGGRTEREWRNLTNAAGFDIETIIATSSPSCFMIILQKKA